MYPAGRGSGSLGLRPAGDAKRAGLGVSLLELLIVLAVLGLLVGMSMPALDQCLARARLRSAAGSIAATFRLARSEALLRRASVGVVFDRTATGTTYSVRVDGNGNGIRAADIESGVDWCARAPVSVEEAHRGVQVALLDPGPVPRIPPEGGFIPPTGDPVQFGPTDVVSFSPFGSSSSGTVYLTVSGNRMAAVRVLGVTGRIRVWEYVAGGRWEQR